jgi:hypothetical protein
MTIKNLRSIDGIIIAAISILIEIIYTDESEPDEER